MPTTKNETYIITNKGNIYKVESIIGNESQTKEFDNIQQAAEWIGHIKGETNSG